MPADETYLGDGLYASFDGQSFKLRAPRENGDHEVFLDPEVMRQFYAFAYLMGFRPPPTPDDPWPDLSPADEPF
jgi:hypothetical protein